MQSLQVRTGEIKLQILDDSGDERGVFIFNPSDVRVAKRIFQLQDELDVKWKEYEEKAKHCETTDSQIDLLNDVVDYFKGMVDDCFGEGTSDIVFGNSRTLGMFEDFFKGIAPYYQKASDDRLAKYGVTK